MRLLALETSSAIGSIALLDGADVAERFIRTPREQTDLVLPLVEDLLTAAGVGLRDLDAIAFGRGPGSFTGLRIAAAVAQGLAVSADLPVVAVSSLQALAQRAWRELGVADAWICVDARMREVYFARYTIRNGRATLRGEERLGPAAALETAARALETAAGASALETAAGPLETAAGASGPTAEGRPPVGSGRASVASGRAAVGSGRAPVASGRAPVGSGRAPVGSGWAAVGSGWAVYRDELASLLAAAERVVPELVPAARDLLVQGAEDVAAGRLLAPEAALPVYLRDESAWRR